MKDLKMDSSGDVVINGVNGDLQMTTDADTLLAQKIQSLLNTNFGELDWNDQYGLNHVEMLTNSNDLNAVKRIIDNYLRDNLEDYESVNIDGSNYDSATRSLEIIATVKMKNGQEISTQIGGAR